MRMVQELQLPVATVYQALRRLARKYGLPFYIVRGRWSYWGRPAIDEVWESLLTHPVGSRAGSGRKRTKLVYGHTSTMVVSTSFGEWTIGGKKL